MQRSSGHQDWHIRTRVAKKEAKRQPQESVWVQGSGNPRAAGGNTVLLMITIPNNAFSQNCITYHHTFTHHTNLSMALSSSKKNKQGFDWLCSIPKLAFLQQQQFLSTPPTPQKKQLFQDLYVLQQRFRTFSIRTAHEHVLLIPRYAILCAGLGMGYFSITGKHTRAHTVHPRTFTLCPATPVTGFNSASFWMIFWIYYL